MRSPGFDRSTGAPRPRSRAVGLPGLVRVRSVLTSGGGTGAGRLILGGRFGEQPDVVSFRLLDRFAAAGGRIVETAAGYADGAGERAIGRSGHGWRPHHQTSW